MIEIETIVLERAHEVSNQLRGAGSADYRRSVDAIVAGVGYSARGALIVAIFSGLDALNLDWDMQIPLVQQGFEELGEMAAEIQPRDLAMAQRVGVQLNLRGSADYRESADKIIAGEEGYTATGALLAAVFTGLDALGVDSDKQVILTQKGLMELGLSVSTE